MECTLVCKHWPFCPRNLQLNPTVPPEMIFVCVCVGVSLLGTGMAEPKQHMIKKKSRFEMGLRNQIWPLLCIDGFCRYQPPNLAISTLYWKAWPLLLVVAAFNPENIGECGHFWGYQFCCRNWPRCFLQKSGSLCARLMLGWWGNCT